MSAELPPESESYRRDIAEFRARQRRIWRLAWYAVYAISVGAIFAVGALWSFAVGIAIGMGLSLVSYELLKRWNRARWLRRFPPARRQR